jgi:hypothetical protein
MEKGKYDKGIVADSEGMSRVGLFFHFLFDKVV